MKLNCRYADLELIFHIFEGSKVQSLVEHPYHPWIVTGHENGNVSLWNYADQTLIASINLTDKEETPKRDNMKSFLRTETKTGNILQVLFFDVDVQKFNHQVGKKFDLESNNETPLFFLSNYIIIITEYRVVFFNYATKAQKELKIAQLDGKPQTCCVVVGTGPLLAFGGSDGIIRIFDTDRWEVTSRLSGGHKSIKSLFSFQSTKLETIIVSSGVEGNLNWWKNFGETPQFKKNIQGDVLDLIYNPLAGQIVTSTSDRTITWWKLQTSDVESRTKPTNSKVTFSILSSFHQHRFGTNSLLISSPSESKVSIMSLEGFTSDFFDTNDFPNSQKKSKVSYLRVHSQFPNMIFVCTRSGSISVIKMSTLPPTFTLAGSGKKKKLFLSDGTKVVGSSLKRKGKPITQKLSNFQGPITLSSSSSGKYISLLWPESSTYQIWEIPKDKTGVWTLKEESKAIDFVWSQGPYTDRFAILTVSSPENTPEAKKKKTNLLVKKKPQTPTLIEKPPLGNIITIKFVSDTGITEIENTFSQKINALRLHGGLLLGLSYEGLNNSNLFKKEKETPKKGGSMRMKTSVGTHNRVHPPSTPTGLHTSKSGAMDEWKADDFENWLQFVSWDGKSQFDALPDPSFVLWDNSEEFCLIVYPTHFSIFEVRPTFKFIITVNFSISTAVWGNGFLVYANQNSIECLFPRSKSYGPITLASCDPVISYYLASDYSSQVDKHLKPIGEISLVKIEDDTLFYIDSQSMLHTIPLNSPKIQFYLLVISGKPAEAIQLLESFEDDRLKDLAQFLCENNHAKYAVSIEKLCVFTKMQICINYELYTSSLDILPQFIDHCFNNDLEIEGIKMVDQLLRSSQTAGNAEVIEKILSISSQFDESKYEELAVHFNAVQGKKSEKLRQLYEKLVSTGQHHAAVFCSLLMGNEENFKTCTREFSISEYVAYSSRNDEEVSDELSKLLDSFLNSM